MSPKLLYQRRGAGVGTDMQSSGRNALRLLLPTALVLGLAACHAPATPPAGPAPATVANPDRKAPHTVLNLYSGSSTGLVVGATPDGSNPGGQLAGIAFVANSGLPNTYVWAFTPDSTILDRDCHPVTRTEAINIANSPFANSVAFEPAVGGGTAGPVRVQIWVKSSGPPADCPAA